MKFIKLTPESNWTISFSVRVDMIESIIEMRGNTALLILTNKKEYHCLESRENILQLIDKAQKEGGEG